MSFRVVIAIATALVSLMAAKAGYGSETKLNKSTYWAASLLLFLIALLLLTTNTDRGIFRKSSRRH